MRVFFKIILLHFSVVLLSTLSSSYLISVIKSFAKSLSASVQHILKHAVYLRPFWNWKWNTTYLSKVSILTQYTWSTRKVIQVSIVSVLLSMQNTISMYFKTITQYLNSLNRSESTFFNFFYYLETWPGIFCYVCYISTVYYIMLFGFSGRYSFYGNHSSKSAFSTTRGPIQNSKRKHAWNVKIVIIKRKFLHKY